MNLTRLAKAITRALFTRAPAMPYHSRSCQGRRWRREFPEAPNRQVDAFLATVAQAFSYPSREKLKLSPDDAIYGVYRARYRLSGWADSRECEKLAVLMRKRYQVELDELWSKTLTLGELFEAARTRTDT